MRKRDFQLRKQERPGDGIIRIIHEQINLACNICKEYQAHPEESVHEIRKTIKKIRSAIRLLRFSLGEKRFHEENNKFGNISLLLAELRKSDALQDLSLIHI